MKLKVYAYRSCDSCRKALKFLEQKGVACDVVPIRETPPSVGELQAMLRFQGGDLRKLFNTSGQDYRAMNLKEKLPSMSELEALELLSKNGNLVKRPFALSDTTGCVGFREEEWRQLL